MNEVAIQLGSLPYMIHFNINGLIAITPMSVGVLLDGKAQFFEENYKMGESYYRYGEWSDYKANPDFLEYLQSLNLDINKVLQQLFMFRNFHF